jgi:dienelactone hydrolase
MNPHSNKLRSFALTLVVTALLSSHSTNGIAKIITKTVDYELNGSQYQGFLAYDDSIKGQRPGVLIVHQWLGLTNYEKQRAIQIASLGYVAFAADIYGKGIRPTDTSSAGALAMKYKSNRSLLRTRVEGGLDQLTKNRLVDTSRIAAIGYCFGGTSVIELALSGAPIRGVVSFHGDLDAPSPTDAANIKGKVLALAGADDPFQNPKNLEAFESEMRENKVDWQLVQYGGAVHAFTQPDPGFSDPGARYNERADRRSWQAMRNFFDEIFQ